MCRITAKSNQPISDKPWVTDRFRSLIKRRQYAFRTGNSNDYNKYRNASQRFAKTLRTEFYNRQISKLRQSSPRKWWRSVKQFVGLARSNDSDDLIGLSNEIYDSDSDKMASDINDFFHSVSGDSTTILVFPHQTGWQYSDGNLSNGGVECKKGIKNQDFRPISGFISELMQDRAIVTMEGE